MLKGTNKQADKVAKKVVAKKEISKGNLKLRNTVAKFEAKKVNDVLTVRESVYLANALYKLDNKSASKLYKDVQNLPEAIEVLGKANFPEFKIFVASLPNKDFFSFYDALNVLARMNKASQQATKVKKQGGQIGKKANAQTSKKLIGA